MSIRLPGLLDATLAETGRLHPMSGSLTLAVKGAHEASMTLPEGTPVKLHDWVSIYSPRALAGIFRVTNITQTYASKMDITLLHGRDILSDSVWQAQTEFSGTKTEYLTALLNQQTQLINGVKPWVLGTCEDTSSFKRSINYDRLSTLLEELEEDGGTYYFVYDQTSFPWTISFVAKPAGDACEFRLGRNVHSASVTYNDADLCTKLILSNNHRSPDEDTSVTSNDMEILVYDNAAAQAEYGIVIKTADIDTADDVKNHEHAEADAWAAKFLAQRTEPSVQIQIDGEELAALTGDTWDEMAIGKMCRVAIQAYGHTFHERVVSVTYPDLFKIVQGAASPDRITVSLANTLPRFSESIASAQRDAAAAGHAACAGARAAANAKELTTWSQTVKYYGEALDGTGVMTLYESGIDMDATGGVTIYSLVEGVQALYSGIQAQAGRIDLVVTGTGTSASINISAIVDDINNSDSLIQLNASKIYLNGEAIANSISAVSAEVTDLITGTTKATLINADAFAGDAVTGGTVYATDQLSIGSGSSGGSGTLYYRGAQYYRQGLTLGPTNSPIAEGHFLGDGSTTVSLNHSHSITMTEHTTGDHAGEIEAVIGAAVTESDSQTHSFFDIAATDTYAAGRAAAGAISSAVWDESTNRFTVTSGLGRTAVGTIGITSTGWSGGVKTYTLTGSKSINGSADPTQTTLETIQVSIPGVDVDPLIPNDDGYSYTYISAAKKYSVSYSVGGKAFTYPDLSAADAYNAGWGAAADDVSLPYSSQTSDAYFDASGPSSTVDGTPLTRRYTVSVDNDFAYIKTPVDGSDVTVARAPNSAAAAGAIASAAWNANTNSFTVTTGLGRTAVGTIGITSTGWSGGVKTYTLTGSKSINGSADPAQTTLETIQVSIPGVDVDPLIPNDDGYSYTYISAAKKYSVSYSVGGKAFTYPDLSAADAYNAGWREAADDVSLPYSSQTSDAYFDASGPSSTVDGIPLTRRYTVSVDNDYAYITTPVNGSDVTVARAPNSATATVTGVSIRSAQVTASGNVFTIPLSVSLSNGTSVNKTINVQISLPSSEYIEASHAYRIYVHKPDEVYSSYGNQYWQMAANTAFNDGMNKCTMTVGNATQTEPSGGTGYVVTAGFYRPVYLRKDGTTTKTVYFHT